MRKLAVLDCTLRDGGYVNEWRFGRRCITQIAKKLCESSIDYIECGFLSQTKSTCEDQSIFRTIEEANATFSDCSKEIGLMINCGEFNPLDMPKYNGGKTSLLRIAFHKYQSEEAMELCAVIKSKGYHVFFQPMVTSCYSDEELLSLIKLANKNNPDAFYIVDSFGTMRKSDVLRMFYLIDNNLAPSIKIGFHSHNNLQLSFSNAQELIRMHTKRDLIIDSSVLGMGRGAGNLCTELLTQFINDNIKGQYNLLPILEIMDENIMPIYTNRPWGYSAPYYIAAINDCHPNYATYLVNRQTLCMREINAIIKRIPSDKKAIYNPELIANIYVDYQKHIVNDDDVIKEISELCREREILIFAPGKSLTTYEKEIQEYINSVNPVIFSINHIPQKFRSDRIFISNLKRFRNIEDAVEQLGERLICTSNIMQDEENVKVVNYTSYLNDNDIISDNSGLMLINILRKVGVKKMALAGFDGFDSSVSNNYFDNKLGLGIRNEKYAVLNDAIAEYFSKLKNYNITVTFLTPSIYNRKEKS